MTSDQGGLDRTAFFSSGLFFLFFRMSFFTGTSTHSSGCFEAFGLFSSGFLLPGSSGLSVVSLALLRESCVELPAGSRSVWFSSCTKLGSLFLLLLVLGNLQAEEILQEYKEASIFFITAAQLLDLLLCYSSGKIGQVYPPKNFLSPISLKDSEIIVLVNLFWFP